MVARVTDSSVIMHKATVTDFRETKTTRNAGTPEHHMVKCCSNGPTALLSYSRFGIGNPFRPSGARSLYSVLPRELHIGSFLERWRNATFEYITSIAPSLRSYHGLCPNSTVLAPLSTRVFACSFPLSAVHDAINILNIKHGYDHFDCTFTHQHSQRARSK